MNTIKNIARGGLLGKSVFVSILALAVAFGGFFVANTAYAADSTVASSADLQTAISGATAGDVITISGTIGATDDYTAYEITEPITIQGDLGSEIYGSFIIKTDGVTIDGLKIYVRGGNNGPLKNGVDVIAKTATITNNVFELPNPEALALNGNVGNGLTVWPVGDADPDYNISGNIFNGFSADTSSWSSSALQIVEGLDLARFDMGGTVSAVVDLDPTVEKALALGNTYNNCTNDYVHSNWTSGIVYKFFLASNEDQLSGVQYTADGSTIVLNDDITTTEQLTINNGITLDGNSHTITAFTDFGSDNNTKHLIDVFAGTEASPVTLSNLTLDSNNNSYGLQAYGDAYLVTDGVTLKNSNGAGLTVNGSTVVSSNLNTNNNSWGAVNVDPGSGVITPSVFILNSGALSESNQIWSDGNHVTSGVPEVTVDTTGDYTKYKVDGTTAFYVWANKAIASKATTVVNDVPTIFTTIQDAVDATTNSIVNVGAGAYVEDLTLNNPVSLLGPNANVNPNTGTRSAEAVLTGKIVDYAGDTDIKGFTITNPSYSGVTIKGVHIYAASTPISNVAVENNIFSNINNANTKGSYAVMVQGAVSNVSVSDNKIDGVTSAGWAHAIEVTPTCNSLTVPQSVNVNYNYITNVTNTAHNDEYAFSVDWCDAAKAPVVGTDPIFANASQISFQNNNLGSLNVRNLDTGHSLNATNNWWGTYVEADILDLLSENVDYTPWYKNSEMTITTSGNDVLKILPDETTGSSSDGDVTVTMVIPSGTTVTGGAGWDGVIDSPTTSTATVTVSGFTTDVTSAITVGSSDSDLTFDNAVKLTFSGQEGKRIGWYNTSGTFTEITDTCDTDDGSTTINSGAAFPDGGSCKIDSNGDLVVWTKHFSTFVTYTQTAIPATPTPPRSSSAGQFTPQARAAILAAQPNASPVSVVGRVLGAGTFNFARDLALGTQGDDVTELQNRLTSEGVYNGPVTGYFGPLTLGAVKAYQNKMGVSNTGYVGPLTRAQLNKSVVLGAETTSPEVLAQIATVKVQLVNLIQQLIEMLQAEVQAQQ